MTTLRKARDEDREFLWALHTAAMRSHVERIWGWDEADQRERFLAGFDPTGRQIIELDGAPIGVWHVERHPDRVFLSGVEIMPAHQGRGIGSGLVRALQREAEDEGLPVELQVLLGNPAVRLYARLGFRETERTETHVRMAWDPLVTPGG